MPPRDVAAPLVLRQLDVPMARVWLRSGFTGVGATRTPRQTWRSRSARDVGDSRVPSTLRAARQSPGSSSSRKDSETTCTRTKVATAAVLNCRAPLKRERKCANVACVAMPSENVRRFTRTCKMLSPVTVPSSAPRADEDAQVYDSDTLSRVACTGSCKRCPHDRSRD
jgi:hypothetical protein